MIQDIGKSPLPARCGQGLVSATVVEGEPLHVRAWQLLAAGDTYVYEINDAGEPVPNGSGCHKEGSVSDYVDFFIDRARHERVLLIKQRRNAGDEEVEVTTARDLVKIHGAGCDELRPLVGPVK